LNILTKIPDLWNLYLLVENIEQIGCLLNPRGAKSFRQHVAKMSDKQIEEVLAAWHFTLKDKYHEFLRSKVETRVENGRKRKSNKR